MKPKSKKHYPFVVECENSKQTNIVLNYYDNDDEIWAHWKYVLINSKLDKDIFDTKNFIDNIGEINIISFEEWSNLPEEEEIFKLKCGIVGYYRRNEKLNENKKIIGYNLINENYLEAFCKLFGYDKEDVKPTKLFPFSFSSNCEIYGKMVKLNLIDIWCKPVYEETKESKIMDFLAEKGIEINEKMLKKLLTL